MSPEVTRICVFFVHQAFVFLFYKRFKIFSARGLSHKRKVKPLLLRNLQFTTKVFYAKGLFIYAF
jgi:hypothetical protein